jgi:hypothetical protein
MKLDDLIIFIVVVGFIILRIARAVKGSQPPPVRTPPPGQPREVEITLEDIEEMLGRRRQLTTPAPRSQTPGTLPGSQGRPGFPTAAEGGSEFQDMSEVLVRGGPPGGPVLPGLPAPDIVVVSDANVEQWAGRRQPRRPPSRPQSEEEVRSRASEEAPTRPPDQPEHPPSGRMRKPHAEPAPFHLPAGLTPMQRAIVFAEILGKPGGRYASF